MPNYNSTSRTPFAKGGRAGFKDGTGDAKVAESEAKASRKMKAEVAAAAKIKRDKLQARHVSPGGGGKYKYGPHKVDDNRKVIEGLIGKGKVQEKIIKFADKVDKKLDAYYKKKAAKQEMQKKAKKLTAYEGTT